MNETKVFSFLPPEKAAAAATHYRRVKREGECLSELRLRAGRAASLTLFSEGKCRNVPLPLALDESEVRAVFSHACGGSLYAFEESIKEGFLTVSHGVRVGVGGTAVVQGGTVQSLASVSSLVFRVPHDVPSAADALLASFRARPRGMLLYAPPGMGKTTMLRAFAGGISRGDGALRAAVIDTRGELSAFPCDALADVLSGYPKAQGAEIAVRTLSPEVLVMDEIGAKEVSALSSLSAFGVPLVASAHAKTAEELSAGAVGTLISRGVFASLWSVAENREVEL